MVGDVISFSIKLLFTRAGFRLRVCLILWIKANPLYDSEQEHDKIGRNTDVKTLS